ncbi:MAG: hypothetical protein GX324_04080 [Aeromonadales bacterium]|nr:hypothetical protein [Aeromonadales bacterium]
MPANKRPVNAYHAHVYYEQDTVEQLAVSNKREGEHPLIAMRYRCLNI